MAQKPLKHSASHHVVRSGEGISVDVSILPTSGGLSSQFSINTAGLPVPDRRLSCDTVSLVRTDYLVKLLFAQKVPTGEGYLSVLVVQMSFEAASNFIHTMDQLNPGIEELERQGSLQRGTLTDITGKPDQSAVVTASIVMTGYSGNDGCLDFYYISPFAIQRINMGNKLAVEPVVRVQLPTPLMVALVRALIQLVPSLPVMINKEVTL